MSTTSQIYTGTDDFAKLLLESDVWVDKSLFIKEFLENGDEAILITRPRRWGKSINMDMLKRFLAIEVDSKGQPLPREQCVNHKLFVGGEATRENGEKKQLPSLKIAQEHRLMQLYQGKYPVISLGLKNVKGCDYEEIVTGVKKELATLFKHYDYLLSSRVVTTDEHDLFRNYMRQQVSVVDVTSSLGFLSELLHKHFQKKVCILVDEYDAPINHAYATFKDQAQGTLKRVLEFFSTLFGTAFKTNPHLKQGLITGILRIAKANIFSDLNNLSEYSLLDKRFATSYGFMQAEVDTLLRQAPTPTPPEQIKAWYNGYTWGGEVVYNPWSIMRCLSEQGALAPYWIDSGGTNLVDDRLIDDEMQEDLQKLMQGDIVRCSITTQLSFDDIETPEGLYSLLLFSGYLNPKRLLTPGLKIICELTIPNEEVRQIYGERILKWVIQKLNVNGKRYHDFVYLLAEGQCAAFEKMLQNYLHGAASFHHTGANVAELFYSGFMFCLLNTLSAYYVVRSEQEGIRGRSDALLIPKPDHGTEALVLEYKVTPDATQLLSVAQAGIDQILQKGYAQPALQHEHVRSARAICIAFSGKEVALALQQVVVL